MPTVKMVPRISCGPMESNNRPNIKYIIPLRDEGWTVLRFWESDIKNNIDDCIQQIIDAITNAKIKARRA